MKKDEKNLRKAIVEACRWMNATRAQPGHLGQHQRPARRRDADHADRRALRPAGPDDLPPMPLHGEYGAWEGPLDPSSEWRFHLDIMRARPDVGAIVHAHSAPTATALAVAPQGDPGLPLHDRRLRRPHHPLRRLRDLRHQGAVGRGAGGARGPDLLPARPTTA